MPNIIMCLVLKEYLDLISSFKFFPFILTSMSKPYKNEQIYQK